MRTSEGGNRFNGFHTPEQTVETVETFAGAEFTQLKQGVNEMSDRRAPLTVWHVQHLTANLILAPDVARDTYRVPALAGRASANPHRADCLTRHRLKAGLHTFQNENC